MHSALCCCTATTTTKDLFSLCVRLDNSNSELKFVEISNIIVSLVSYLPDTEDNRKSCTLMPYHFRLAMYTSCMCEIFYFISPVLKFIDYHCLIARIKMLQAVFCLPPVNLFFRKYCCYTIIQPDWRWSGLDATQNMSLIWVYFGGSAGPNP